MADIKVIIDGQICELPPQGLNLPLTFSLKDKNGLTINTGSRSEYAFELPATKHNDSIFNQFYDPAVYTQAEQMFLDASIEVDGMPFFRGRCQLQSANLRQDQYYWQGKSYKVAFFGNNADWATRIGDLLLKDLDYTVHTYSYADNITAWNNTYPTWDYKYILLKLKDYTTFGQVDGLEDSHPALFVAGLIDKIFATIGYTVSSGFFTTNFFKKLILPVPILNKYLQEDYGNDYLNIEANEAQINYGGFSPILVFPNQTSAPLVGPNPYDNTTGIYTCPVLGYYLFEVEVRMTNITTSAGCTFGFSINGNPIVEVWGQSNLGPPQPYTTDTVIRAEKVLYLSAGDTVAVAGISVVVVPGTYDFAANLKITGEAELVDNFQYSIGYSIDRSLKAIDLIKGLAHAFNLVFETNEGSRTVRIEPADDFLIESRNPDYRSLEDGFYTDQKVTDLTQYIDLSKGGELTTDTKSQNKLRLKWKDDSNDPTVEALNQNQNLGILEAQYNFPINRFKEGENIIENPFFAPTIVIADIEPMKDNSEKTPMIPMVWLTNYIETSTSSEAVTQMLPRLLVAENIATDYDNGIIWVWTGAAKVDFKAPLNYMIDYNDMFGYQTSLSFGDETVNGFPVSGLMKRFYLAEMLRIKGGKFLECFVFWDVAMLNNLTFRNKITINNNNYILQEISSFDVAKRQSTKTYFVLDYKEAGAESGIESTIIQAKVNT